MSTTTEKVSLRIPFDAVFGKPKPPPERRRRWLRWVAVGVIGFGILFWLLPTIIAHSFLLNWIVGYLAADFQGKIHVGGASLGWFSPVVLRQIEVQDGQEQPLATIDQLTGQHTLWKLLRNRQDLGRWMLEGAKLHITVRPDGSNWEDALAKYLTASDSAPSSAQVELELKDTVVFFTDSRSRRSWRLDNLQGVLQIPAASTEPWRLLCTGQVCPTEPDLAHAEPEGGRPSDCKPEGFRPSGSQAAGPEKTGSFGPGGGLPAGPGRLQLELLWGGSPPECQTDPTAQTSSSGGYFVLRGQDIPMGLAEAILMRWEPLLHLEGRGSGWFVYGWGMWAEHVAAGRAAPAASSTKPETQASSIPAASGPSASASSPSASSNVQNMVAGEPVASSSRRPEAALPPDSVVMQADITSPEAWVHWKRFVPERLPLNQMKLQGSVIWTNDYIEWADFQLDCQTGKVTISGRTPLSAEVGAWLDALRTYPCQVWGRLDLVQLTRMLPQTLPLQAETQVTSGLVEFNFTSRPAAGSTTWQAHLLTSQLKALHQGRAIEWPEPVRFQLAAQQTPEGLVLETLQCISEFLRIDAFSAEAGWSISAQMDLDRLSRRLSPWVDLGNTQLAGQAALSLTWTNKPQDGFEADLVFQGDRLRVVIPAWSLEIADDIRARALITGKTGSSMDAAAPQAGAKEISDPAGRPTSTSSQSGSAVSLPIRTNLPSSKVTSYSLSRIDSAVAAFQWGQDQGEIRLRQPVSAPSLKTRWPVELRLQGQLADWVRRLKPWVDLEAWQPNGAYGLAASLDLGPESLQVHEARLAAAPFYLNAFGLQVAEPRVDLSVTGQWDWASHRLQLTQVRLQANPLVLEAQKVQVQWPSPAGGVNTDKPPAGSPAAAAVKLAAQLHAQGTLEHLQRWFAPTSANGWRVGGAFTAQAELQTDGGATTGLGQITIRQFTYTASPGSRAWQQPQIQLAAQGRYHHQTGLLELTSCRLQGDGMEYGGTVQVSPAAPSDGAKEAAIYSASGQLQYDWQRLSPLVRSYLGAGILLQGRGAEPLRWQGPLDLALAEGSLGIGWQQIDAYGFRGGPAVLRGHLSQGWLRIAPVEMDLSEGKLRAAGAVRLAPGPMELLLEKGSAARQIRISPQMCASAFQYIAPVLADVTTVEGRVSLLLDVCRVPLANPAASQIQGQLVIHNIQIGPGPLVQELATLLMKEPTARLRNEAVIPFTMANGRIYHEGLELVFPEITIRTQGYVGLDQSLALTAEMPILPKWTAMNPRLAAAMKDQTIRLPIHGTLRRPQLDQATLRRYAAQFLQKSAENLLQDELQRQLDRLKLPGR